MKKYSLIGVAAASVLALSACGTSAPSSSPADSAAKTPTRVTVGVIPIVSTAPIFLGKEKGFFTDEGIDLTIETSGGGAAVVPAVIAGSYDFGYGNYTSVMLAREKGLDLKYIANGTTTAGDPDWQAVIVPINSPIKTPADLAGKTVAVNQLKNVNDTTIRSVVVADGGDESTIKFVEVAFPDAEAAVTNKQVDAAVVNPFLGVAAETALGNRVIMYNFSEFDPDLDISGYFTTGATIKDKPALVKAFTKAINKSLTYAQAHPEEARQIVTTYTKITADKLKDMPLPKWRTEINRDALKKLGAAGLKYGTLKAEPDLDAMLP